MQIVDDTDVRRRTGSQPTSTAKERVPGTKYGPDHGDFVLSPFYRYTTLIYGAVLMIAGGTPYMVGLYSSLLKGKLGYTETQSVLVETCTHVGLYCGITQGIFYDRFGMRAASLLAAVLVGAGYMGVYLALENRAGASLVGFWFFLVGQGSHGFYTVAASVNIRNFSATKKGKVMGFLAAMFAMSGAIFTPIAWQFGIKVVPAKKSSNESALCSVDPEASISHAGGDAEGTENELYYFLFLSGTLCFIGLLACVIMKREPEATTQHTPELLLEMLPVEPESQDDEDMDVVLVRAEENVRKMKEEVDIYALRLLRDPRFILLFLCMLIEDGTAVMFSNTIGSTHEALGDDVPLPKVGTLLIVFSACSATGRAVWGVISDFFYTDRALVLGCTMLTMGIGHLTVVLFPTQLLLATIVIGFSFGGMFAIAPVITSEQFGNKHFGTNWGCVVFAPALGSIAYNALYGYLYELSLPIGCSQCFGISCFKRTFIITSASCFVGVILSIILVITIRWSSGPNVVGPAQQRRWKREYRTLE